MWTSPTDIKNLKTKYGIVLDYDGHREEYKDGIEDKVRYVEIPGHSKNESSSAYVYNKDGSITKKSFSKK